MQQYILSHGIASCISVYAPYGREYTAIYYRKGKIVLGVREQPLTLLPAPVCAAIERRFDEVFALPTEDRESWIKANKTETVEVDPSPALDRGYEPEEVNMPFSGSMENREPDPSELDEEDDQPGNAR